MNQALSFKEALEFPLLNENPVEQLTRLLNELIVIKVRNFKMFKTFEGERCKFKIYSTEFFHIKYSSIEKKHHSLKSFQQVVSNFRKSGWKIRMEWGWKNFGEPETNAHSYIRFEAKQSYWKKLSYLRGVFRLFFLFFKIPRRSSQ